MCSGFLRHVSPVIVKERPGGIWRMDTNEPYTGSLAPGPLPKPGLCCPKVPAEGGPDTQRREDGLGCRSPPTEAPSMLSETLDARATLSTFVATVEGKQMFSFYLNSECSFMPNVAFGGNIA